MTCEFSGLDRQLESLIRGYNVGVEESKRIRLDYNEGLTVTTSRNTYHISLTRDFPKCEIDDPELDVIRKLAEMLGELQCIPFTPSVVVKSATEVDGYVELTMSNDEVIDVGPVRQLPKGQVTTVLGDDPDLRWHYREIDIPQHAVSELMEISNPVTKEPCSVSVYYRLGEVVLVNYPSGYEWHRVDSLPAQLGHGNNPESQVELPALYEGLEYLIDDGRAHVETHLPDETEHHTTDADELLNNPKSEGITFEFIDYPESVAKSFSNIWISSFDELPTTDEVLAHVFQDWTHPSTVDVATTMEPSSEDTEGFTWKVNITLPTHLENSPGVDKYLEAFNRALLITELSPSHIKPTGKHIEFQIDAETYSVLELTEAGRLAHIRLVKQCDVPAQFTDGFMDLTFNGQWFQLKANVWAVDSLQVKKLFLIIKDSNE